MSEKVVVLGAGIGGMTVAHELAHSKSKKYNIHVYERNDSVGGMARSSFKERKGVKLPTVIGGSMALLIIICGKFLNKYP